MACTISINSFEIPKCSEGIYRDYKHPVSEYNMQFKSYNDVVYIRYGLIFVNGLYQGRLTDVIVRYNAEQSRIEVTTKYLNILGELLNKEFHYYNG